MEFVLTVTNDGAEILDTNYWASEAAKRGFAFLTINAGTFRLLVPEKMAPEIAEWKTAREVVVSKGPWPAQGREEAIEIMFEDNSDSPYALNMGIQQLDRMPTPADRDRSGQPARWHFSVWTQRDGKVLELPGRYRLVKQIPWLKPF